MALIVLLILMLGILYVVTRFATTNPDSPVQREYLRTQEMFPRR